MRRLSKARSTGATGPSAREYSDLRRVRDGAPGHCRSIPARLDDGLPDGWEMQYFANLSQTAAGDFDGDGLSNLGEFQTGTDPTNSASAFRITAVAKEGNNIRVAWMSGTGKTNALERSASWISTVSAVPGSPLSVTETVKFTGPDTPPMVPVPVPENVHVPLKVIEVLCTVTSKA